MIFWFQILIHSLRYSIRRHLTSRFRTSSASTCSFTTPWWTLLGGTPGWQSGHLRPWGWRKNPYIYILEIYYMEIKCIYIYTYIYIYISPKILFDWKNGFPSLVWWWRFLPPWTNRWGRTSLPPPPVPSFWRRHYYATGQSASWHMCLASDVQPLESGIVFTVSWCSLCSWGFSMTMRRASA